MVYSKYQNVYMLNSDVKLHFKSEVHIHNLSPSENRYRGRTKSFEQRNLPNDGLEFKDIPKPQFWFHHQSADIKTPSSYGARRRQFLSPIESEARHGSSRRESNTSEERKERTLEILREIVRKCTISDPVKRPTAKELLRILTIKANILRDK
ncbi:hypothetical protein CHUAL_007493 [Chamberlinius hualienensis]